MCPMTCLASLHKMNSCLGIQVYYRISFASFFLIYFCNPSTRMIFCLTIIRDINSSHQYQMLSPLQFALRSSYRWKMSIHFNVCDPSTCLFSTRGSLAVTVSSEDNLQQCDYCNPSTTEPDGEHRSRHKHYPTLASLLIVKNIHPLVDQWTSLSFLRTPYKQY